MSEQLRVRELRPTLREAELTVARIRRGVSPKEILHLYSLLDQIANALPKLQQAGARLEPELVRLETISGILRDKARIIVRRLAANGGLVAYRRQTEPPESHWWWYLDRQVAHQQAQKRKRFLWSVLAAIVILAALGALYVRFLRPDEATRLRYNYQFKADSLLQQGHYAQALSHYQKALELAPEDGEMRVAIGALYEILQQPGNAKEQYVQAETLYETRAAFLTARAQQFTRMGWYERAVEEARAAAALDDRYALAQCALGSAYQGLGENKHAIAALSTCADLASQQGQDELYVHAKTLLAALMQQPS